MSQDTAEMYRLLDLADEQIKKLKALGPVVTTDDLFNCGTLLRLTGSSVLGLQLRMQEQAAVKPQALPVVEKKPSPAMQDLFGR